MERNLLTRALVILVIVGAAALAAWPPQETINLGLDLQGGMHLVLRVQTNDAIKAETDNTVDTVVRELQDLDIEVETDRIADDEFAVEGVPVDRIDEIERDVVELYLPGWRMIHEGGGRLEFSLTTSEEVNIRQMAVAQAQQTIRNRIDQFGVSEPIIHDEGLGSDRIVVQLPGVEDPERVKDLIQSTAFLELKLSVEGSGPADSRQGAIDQLPSGTLADDQIVVPQIVRDQDGDPVGEQFWVLEERNVITGRDLRDARPTTGRFNEPQVSFFLNREGARKFEKATEENIGRGLSIVLDDQVMSVATIQSRISDQGVITGDFSMQEVQDLVTVLKSGALPAGLVFLEERTVGPTLGRDSIEQGESAGLIGMGLVVLAMLVVYHLTGINAIVALGLNIVLVFGALAAFGATLTLPGIAGIVLTIGMAVDANVLIFERIREELRSGRTVKSAISAGFAKALSSVLDANITTLIAAIFLFMFGTGPIRGFAVTLSVGIVASVFTAVFISRFIFDVIYTRRQRVDHLSI